MTLQVGSHEPAVGGRRKRWETGQQVVQRRPERVQIAARVGLRALPQLGGEIAGRAPQQRALRHGGLIPAGGEPRDAEVQQLQEVVLAATPGRPPGRTRTATAAPRGRARGTCTRRPRRTQARPTCRCASRGGSHPALRPSRGRTVQGQLSRATAAGAPQARAPSRLLVRRLERQAPSLPSRDAPLERVRRPFQAVHCWRWSACCAGRRTGGSASRARRLPDRSTPSLPERATT
jgi:hypothetical protein